MTKVVLTQTARNDLVNIIEHIARDSPERAKTYTVKILEKAKNTIALFPLSSPLHSKKFNVRRFSYEKYNIYYQYIEGEQTAYLLHILNSALNQNELLKSSNN